MVYDASSATSATTFGDKYMFLKDQIKWVILGTVAAFFASLLDYKKLRYLALPILIAVIILLIAVFIPGIGVKAYGASRWINLGFSVIQPSEFAKLAMIIYLSAWLTTKERGRLPSFLVLVGIVVGLVIVQPDMGTAIIILLTSLILYFLSDSEMLGFISLLPLVGLGIIGLAIQSPYRLKRLLTYFDPNVDPLGASYHIRQAVIALGSGGLFGLGLGNSRQKYAYLPEATTDSIFAIIGEELGFIGVFILCAVFMVLLYWMVRNTMQIKDGFGQLLGIGIIAYIASQVVVNIASIIALVPLTGVPLPFISYGGSALVVELISVGILVNIWKQAR